MRIHLLVAAVLLASCGTAPVEFDQAAASTQLRATSEGELCSTLTAQSSPSVLRQMAQAELAVRGVNNCGMLNIGDVVFTQAGTTTYSRDTSASPGASSPLSVDTGSSDPAGSGVDCADFSSGAVAQRYFLAMGGPVNDPHNLDGDGDGLACEWASQLRTIRTYRPAPAPVYVPAPRSNRYGACITGPRGGTYMMINGRKDYDAC